MKLKSILFVLYTFAILFVGYNLFHPTDSETQITDKTPVQSNIIERDPYKLPPDICSNELNCYYTANPLIDIKSVGSNDYMLSASLCERRWQKLVNIKPRDSPRNMIIVGPYIDKDLRVGAWGQYYRLYGSVGFGGGFVLSQGYAAAQGGLMYMW